MTSKSCRKWISLDYENPLVSLNKALFLGGGGLQKKWISLDQIQPSLAMLFFGCDLFWGGENVTPFKINVGLGMKSDHTWLPGHFFVKIISNFSIMWSNIVMSCLEVPLEVRING